MSFYELGPYRFSGEQDSGANAPLLYRGGFAAQFGRRRRAIPTQENDLATAREHEREEHGRLDRAGASRGWSSMRWLRTRPKPKISGEAAPYS